MLSHCPNCGAPAPRRQRSKEKKASEDIPTGTPVKDQPQLGKGMMAFIIIGLLLLIAFFTFQYMAHRNDPDYFRTLINPDTTLADRDEVRFEQAPVDTAAAAKEEEEAKREAEKMYNSIRRQPQEEEPTAEESTTDNAAETEGGAPAETTTPTPAEPAPTAPTPKVEAIE